MVEITPSHEAQVGELTVRRALPRRTRRTVGPWCFADHMGPADVAEDSGPDIGPHPHTGLQTVTWLLDGQVLHRDSLGSEQVISPGQLNLMSAGHGVSHAEESTGHYRGVLEGIQLWIAQPEGTRHGPAAFEHHGDLPQVELEGGVASVLMGSLDGAVSPARQDSPTVGIDLDLHRATTLALDPQFEHALVVLRGAARVDEEVATPGHLAFLGVGRDELALDATEPTRVLLIGGAPFPEPIRMWWNFVARTREEMVDAQRAWQEPDGRFGRVASRLPLIPAPALP